MEYMTIEEAAELRKVRSERIEYTCEKNGIEGAAKLCGKWIIPKDIVRPTISQLPRAKQSDTEARKNRTDVQQAFMDAFRDGAVPFGVRKHKIGKTTYIVTSCSSPNAKKTFSEIMLSMILRDLNSNISVTEYNKIMKELRQKEIERQPSYSEYMKNIKAGLGKMGFGEEDVATLMDKYAEAYRPLEEL